MSEGSNRQVEKSAAPAGDAESTAERVSAEELLRRQLDFTSAITSSLGEGVYALDRDGRLTFMNPAAERMLGWTQDELLGEMMHERVHFQRPDGTRVPAEECPVLDVIRTQTTYRTDDDIYTRKDGRLITVTYTSAPIASGGEVTGAVVAFRDISERKRIEAELRASEERYRALADAMPQLVWVTDENGAHFYYNRRWYEYTGLSEEESLGFGFTNALHPDDKERTLAQWERAWRRGEGYEIEYRFYSRPQGAYRWFLGRAEPVRDERGRVTQWVGTCTDIEEQKQMEALLARLNEERELMIEEVSTPVVPVLEGVLVLPLIGSLDTVRMERATKAALQEVTRTGARSMILDITGARIIDSHAVANLSNLVQALKLVGAEAIVTGIGIEAAQSLVGLGLDLQGMRTHRTLAEALAGMIKRGWRSN